MLVPKKKFDAQTKLVGELQQTVYQMQLILANQETLVEGTGNQYKAKYKSAIEELAKKYENQSDWGNWQARAIVDLRSAFIIGQGITPVERDDVTKESKKANSQIKYQKELDYIKQFLQHNDLDEEGVQDLAKEAEIEGRVLFSLNPNFENKQIDLRFISLTQTDYEIENKADDYKVYEKAKYRLSDRSSEIVLDPSSFVYKKFAGRANKVMDFVPKIATLLRLLEDLDKALYDFRKINDLYASPTPTFTTQTAGAGKNLDTMLQKLKWKIGKYLVLNQTEFKMVSAESGGSDSIEKEITILCKMISGATGIPVHFLGLPDLMSNRSTSTDLFEMIIASTSRETRTWIGCYEEVFTKVLAMSNVEFGTNFVTDAISCSIPNVTANKLKELAEVWLPLYVQDAISLEYFISKIPGTTPEEMAKQLERENKPSNEDVGIGNEK